MGVVMITFIDDETEANIFSQGHLKLSKQQCQYLSFGN
jgi:hypothetical protein